MPYRDGGPDALPANTGWFIVSRGKAKSSNSILLNVATTINWWSVLNCGWCCHFADCVDMGVRDARSLILMRNAAFQRMMNDAGKYRLAMKAKDAAVTRPVPRT